MEEKASDSLLVYSINHILTSERATTLYKISYTYQRYIRMHNDRRYMVAGKWKGIGKGWQACIEIV